jgi:hypothetical protein
MMNGTWWGLAGGVFTALVISTVQRTYPDISFVALLGVGLFCGALLNVVRFVVSRTRKRS